jgi:SpoIIAA-like
MIEALDGFPAKVLAFACKGHVTKRDYETVLIPAVEEGLKKQGKMRLYYQVGPDFSGIDPGAMWDDFKVGIEHVLRWERIAVVADVDWIRHTIRAFSFLIPAKVKVFQVDEAAKAREWIVEGLAP